MYENIPTFLFIYKSRLPPSAFTVASAVGSLIIVVAIVGSALEEPTVEDDVIPSDSSVVLVLFSSSFPSISLTPRVFLTS